MAAHMIPPEPKEYDPKSDEGKVFLALKNLPEDYYVFHSVKVSDVQYNKYVDREVDFVVFNRKKGVLCIEAKNGNGITYHDRDWYYTSGKKMEHEGPYKQVSTAKRTLRRLMTESANEKVKDISKRCKFFHAVWFFNIDRDLFVQKNNIEGLPEDAPLELTMFKEDMADPTKAIEHIFNLNISIPTVDDDLVAKHDISSEEFQFLLDSVFCPEFNLVPSVKVNSGFIETQMVQLLHEQYRLLDFLEDQDTAVINGAAGTGKTMIAVEKARRNSINGEKVLFLCYNRLLCEHLQESHKNSPSKTIRQQFKNVDFLTIHKLTYKVTGNYKDTDGLQEWLLDCMDDPEKFGYKHVIIDEGQDFGLLEKEANSAAEDAETNCSIIEALQETVLSINGTFYLFYDKYQTIQGGGNVEYKLPTCITDSDCRLTLHYNCRNTKKIAATSVTPLKDKKNRAIKLKTACSWYEPVTPVMHIRGGQKNAVKALQSVLNKYRENEIDDVVILVQGKTEFSMIADQLEVGTGKNAGYDVYTYQGIEYRVTTCIKFKGLEATAIVMIGLDKDSFVKQEGREFYVGTSRAKQFLDFITVIKPENYVDVVRALAPDVPIRRVQPELMKTLLSEIFAADIETE